ncbi:MAG TPA: hypothetical protein VHT96_12330 [Clostridia bacterium]|nr:hypothetical protein [Clostridia bacterium]
MDVNQLIKEKLDYIDKHRAELIAKCEAGLVNVPEDQLQTQKEILEVMKKGYSDIKTAGVQ